MNFPGGKLFAFTILDDTDDATLENIKPVYGLLCELGFRTTKTAWPMDCPEGSVNFFAADTLQDEAYRLFVKQLIEQGFEFASHGATMESSLRNRTLSAIRFIKEEMTDDLRLHCNHAYNAENLYWGVDRYQTGVLRAVFGALSKLRKFRAYYGHMADSEYFWGDVCEAEIDFVRNFTFPILDNSRIPPGGPYRLASTPFVNYWFSSSDAPDLDSFLKLVTRSSVDRLAENRGYSIVSTHLGKGFTNGGEIDSRFEDIMRYIAEKNGWFVPTSVLLDHLKTQRSFEQMNAIDHYRLEFKHLLTVLAKRLSSK